MPKALRSASRNHLFVAILALSVSSLVAYQLYFARRVQAVSPSVVISQVYGGGGNSGAPYQNDFVELFNRGNATVSLAGWSVEYTSATGAGLFSANTVALSGSIAPGQYYLVKMASNAAVGAPLPAADATNTAIAMAAGAAKVIVANTTSVACNGSSTPCSAAQLAQIVDLVGYGTGASGANFFEGAGQAPTITATTADFRDDFGCTDTDNNGADFSSAAAPLSPTTPAPRNTASTLHPCTANQPIVPTCPGSLNTVQGTPTSAGVSATDADGAVTSATITSAPVTGITLTGFTPAGASGGTATATLSVANTTAAGTYNVTIQYANNDSPTPQTATCTVVVNVTAPNQPIVPSCPGSFAVNQGSAGSTNVSAADPDGTVTSASITSTPVAGITLGSFTPAGAVGGTASATLNVANTTAVGTYNVNIQWTNNDSPTPQTANCTVVVTVQPSAPTNNVVISQVYGGGGNSGSTLKNDYIELINHSSSPVNLTGWSVQAFVSTTGTWQVTPLTNFTLQPGQYYLVQEAAQGGGTDDLPTPDAIGSIPVSSASTKVALVNNTTTITAACPNAAAAGIVDLVGYGNTTGFMVDCFEGSGAAPTLSNTTAALRLNEGCFDTNDNSIDFVSGAPNPRNSSSPAHLCTGLSATGSANPSTVLQGNSTTLTVHVAPAQDPTSNGLNVTADLSLIGGSASQSFAGSGTTFTYTAAVPANNPSGMKSLPVTVTDGQGRTANTNILVSVLSTTPEHVTISQVYGGGGNAGATYSNDYVELYNPTASPISMTGWSLQYGSAIGTSFSGKQVIGGTIEPGHYYLVSMASGGANGAPLPLPAVTGTDINMAAGAGKIALVSNSATLIGACPVGSDPDIVDFVGYGGTANCHEGNANAPGASNTTALFRNAGGGTDTDQNGNDFVAGPPNPRSTTPPVEFGPSVSGTVPTTNDTIAPYDSSIMADFSEPVDAVGVWYNVTCTITGLHSDGTVAHSNDYKAWAFTPNATFQFGEQCTATIYKNQIHDQDTDDSVTDTDTLAADYVWSFTVVGAGQAAPYAPSVHLTMGNPSNAVSDPGQPLNYLMMKPTYATSYNRDKGTPNWVSWHLDSSWYGSLVRVDTFRPDPAVLPDWYRVQAFDYSGSGFDRGHMTPNADRDNQNRIPINQETYLMSNMVPQAPDNNQGPWANMEAAMRTLADGGNELYIISGPAGVGGVPVLNGPTVNTIANGHLTVPASTWKVVLVLTTASGDDVARATCSSRTIAVLMPNTQGIRNTPWQNFITTVDAIEQLTGYDFYSNLPPAVQACVEGGTNGTNPPGTANQSANTTEDNAVVVTLQALQANNNTLTFSIVTGPTSGSVGSVSSASCSSGTCTATVTYTPGANFNGSDSFTFRASDGSLNSNTSTVSVGVSEVNDSPIAAGDSKITNEDTQLTFSSSDLTGNDSAGPAEAGQALTVTSVTADANTHGTVTLTTGMVTYTPAANYNGPASFTYNVCDDGTTNGSPDPKCTNGTVNVTVTSDNDGPDAVDDATTIAEDSGANTINVLGNDSDVDADTLTVSGVTQGTHGSVTNNGSSVSYTPAANFFGTDTFTYTVSDGNGGSDTATVNVTVTNVQDGPDAINDAATIAEDSGANAIDVRANDTDLDGDTLSVTAVTQGTHGSVSITGGGTGVSYTPAANYFGSDSFTYTVSDGNGGTDTATVNVTVTNVQDGPDAVNDAATIAEDSGANAIDVRANDTDLDGDTLSVTAVTQGTHGSVSITGGGTGVSYTPAANYFGSDSFTYTVSDGNGGTDTATVNVTVTNVQDGPDAVDDSTTINEDSGANAIDVRANDTDLDGDTLSVTVVTQGTHGSVAITGGGTGVSYTPAANYFGSDSFTYTVSDGNGGTDTATVNVTVTNVQDGPDAVDDSTTIAEDSGANAIDVRANDTDLDGDTLSVIVVTQGTHGSVAITGGGTGVSYTPAANFFGTDTFTYTVSDGNGGTDTATVTVTITNVQDAPDALNDAATINEDSGANAINVRGNDIDVDGDALTVTAVTQGTHGSVAITGGGTGVSYTPAANYFGSDSFTYTIGDGHGGSDTATVNITVTNVNDAPIATGDSYVTNSNTALNVSAPGVLGNDSDIDGPSLSSVLVANVLHGTLALNANGSFSYNPTLNFEGTDSFTYHAYDGALYSSVVTVTITVNDTVPPVLTSGVAVSLISSTNSNLVNVGLTASATDNSNDPVTIQVNVFGDEDDETATLPGVIHSPDAKDIAPLTLRLRGERVEANDGRVYLIVVTATDSSGNISRSYHTVVVPKNNKQASIDSVNAQAATAASYAQSHGGTPPPGYFVIGDGPIIGPKQ